MAVAYLSGGGTQQAILIGGMVAGIASALGIGFLTRGRRLSEDTAIGVIFAGTLALVSYAERGLKIVWWKVDPKTGAQDLGELQDLLHGGAALVALPHVSNLLGEILDLPAVVVTGGYMLLNTYKQEPVDPDEKKVMIPGNMYLFETGPDTVWDDDTPDVQPPR